MPETTNPYKKSPFNIRYHLLICLFLVVATGAVYYQVKDHEFINLDDELYVENHYVKRGLSLDSFNWAFSFKDKENTYWHPLTWLSLMLDYQLYGPHPGMHHSISLIIHILNSLLLFIVLRKMTGTLWRSACVAMLFALHPINVESVAWVTQRPNILSTSFWMLTMLAYSYYTHRPGLFRYFLVLIIFVLGLMAKPILITLPFVLFLLDYWPLKRVVFPLSQKVIVSLVMEKIPLLAVSMLSVFITINSVVAAVSTETVPMKLRISNALVSYVGYIGKMIWPHNLAVYYPYPFAIPAWKVAGAVFLLLCLSILIIWVIKSKPYLSVGWFWFLGVLVPVIGLVQTGLQPALADRYAYISFIGLFIMIAWGIPDFLQGLCNRKMVLSVVLVVLLLSLTMATWLQLGHWKNNLTLYNHALKVTSENAIAHNNLGTALVENNRTDEAIGHFSAALKILPGYENACYNLGLALLESDSYDDAIYYFLKYINLSPDDAIGYYNIGLSYSYQGKIADSMKYFFKALDMDNAFEEAHFNLGVIYSSKGDYENAIKHYSEALRIKPDYNDVHINLGNIYFNHGQLDVAAGHYTTVLKNKPNHMTAFLNLGAAMLRKGDIEEAVSIFQQANKIKPDDTTIQRALIKALKILKQSKALNK